VQKRSDEKNLASDSRTEEASNAAKQHDASNEQRRPTSKQQHHVDNLHAAENIGVAIESTKPYKLS
jgi:hypothetical protein